MYSEVSINISYRSIGCPLLNNISTDNWFTCRIDDFSGNKCLILVNRLSLLNQCNIIIIELIPNSCTLGYFLQIIRHSCRLLQKRNNPIDIYILISEHYQIVGLRLDLFDQLFYCHAILAKSDLCILCACFFCHQLKHTYKQ